MPRKKVASKAKEIVHLREKKLSNGNVHLYLERNRDGKREREYLKLYLIPEKTPLDKLTNQDVLNAANAIKAERTRAILAEDAGLKRVGHSKILLIDWMQHCADQAEGRSSTAANRHTWGRTIENTADIIKEYAGATVKLVDVDKEFVLDFIRYLRTEHVIKRKNGKSGVQNEGKRLASSTAHKRYQCLRFALNEAVREGLMQKNPCDLIQKSDKIKVPQSTREYLTEEELKRLEDTPTNSIEMRRVHLFMCYSGLRISDVKTLHWEDLEKDGERWRLRIRQQKTQTPLYLPLSKKALQYMPAPEEKSVHGAPCQE